VVHLLAQLWLLVVLSALLWLPGQALLVSIGTRGQWPGLQQLIVTLGLGVAFYPVLFYVLRFWAPMLQVGPLWIGLALAVCAGVNLWDFRRHPRVGRGWVALESVAVLVMGMTLLSRLWVAHTMPYPAWTDSLHHVLLTELTANQGQLPTSLAPYFPVDVTMYHLGLYALSASVEWLANVPAHTALLWTAQVMNGLCGLGVYLALDRYVGRLGAVVGAAVVGLFSFQPALYVNWGRFTQVASQAILLIALVVTLDTLLRFADGWPQRSQRTKLIGQALLSGLLGAGICLLHFRVAAFYAPALLLGVLGVFWPRRSAWQALLVGMLWVGGFTLLLILPTLWAALQRYSESLAYAAVVAALDAPARAQSLQQYYEFPASSYLSLAAPGWLWVTAGLAALLGLWQRNRITYFAVGWMALLLLEGYAYRTGIGALMFTNLGAVLIMLYLPLGLLVGAGVEEALRLIPLRWRTKSIIAGVVLLVAAAIPAFQARVRQLEPYRFFVTEADVTAMRWLDAHLPADARIAVNTEFWLPTVPHGTDAGYWLPYFTGRATTAGVMIMYGDYLHQVADWSRLVVRLETNLDALDALYAQGVGYIYIGARGDFASPGLQLDFLRQSKQIQVLYERDGVAILQILPLNR
jgi:hypothetical protein